MEAKELLRLYLNKFRVECHFKLMSVPTNIKDMPVEIYNDAYSEAKKEMIEEYKIDEKIQMKIDALNRTFISKVKETENYNTAEEYIKSIIEKI